MGIRRTDISMAVRVQRTGDVLVAACTRCSIDNLDTTVMHLFQRKMSKRQWTRIKPMVVDTRHADFSLRAKTNLYLKRAGQMGKSLIIASMQQTDFDQIAVSQRTTMPRVVVE